MLNTGTHTKHVASVLKGEHGRNLKFDEEGEKVVEGKEFDEA